MSSATKHRRHAAYVLQQMCLVFRIIGCGGSLLKGDFDIYNYLLQK